MEEKYLYTAKPTPRHGTTARINDMCQRLHRLAKVNTLIFYFPRKFHRSNIIFQNYDFVIEMPSFLNSCKIRRSQVSDRYAFLKASRRRLARLVRAIFVIVGKEQKKRPLDEAISARALNLSGVMVRQTLPELK